MADEQQPNEEYLFTDPDAVGPMTEASPEEDATMASATVPGENNIKRNALIVLVLIVLIVIVYKIYSHRRAEKTIIEAPPPVATIKPAPAVLTPPPATLPTPVVTTNPQYDQKFSAIQLSQQNLNADLNSLNNQVTGLSSSMQNVSSQLEQLSQVINNLSAKVSQQADEIEKLTVKRAPVVQHRVTRRVILGQMYYIQAVIPGRAWLIGKNGSTLTVREGSPIPGYGVVKLIDPNQGRVLTSSGRVIGFSQTDS